MAPDNNDSISTRERLEFLLDNDRPMTGQTNQSKASLTGETATNGARSQRNAFLAGVAFSGLMASSIFLTHYIDGRLQPSATEGSSASTQKVDAVAATGTAGAQAPAVLAAAINPTSVSKPIETTLAPSAGFVAPYTPPANNQPLTKIPGLSTSRSVITGVVDPLTLTASYYWTFTLKNTTRSNQEAQMNIALPDGAVVSRATLWINGKPQEAAFNSTESVQQAYDWIVTLNRDPLLITQTDANHINLKASPVVPNKEMKIRIGMTVPMTVTASGETQMDMPHISESNLDTSCVQNVHITSDTPLLANNTHMSESSNKSEHLLRGNLDSASLKQLQITMKRDPQLLRFATRATHSFPPSFIVGELLPDGQGLNKLSLTKSESRPECKIISDDHAAFRMSYLWAKEEINRLVQAGDRSQAIEVASVYRVVSPVSGAVVLERNSDYDYNGLDRNLYRSMSYKARDKQQRLIEEKSSATAAGAENDLNKSPMPSAGPPAQTFFDVSRAAPAPVMDDAAPYVTHAKRRSASRSESRAVLQNNFGAGGDRVSRPELAKKAIPVPKAGSATSGSAETVQGKPGALSPVAQSSAAPLLEAPPAVVQSSAAPLPEAPSSVAQSSAAHMPVKSSAIQDITPTHRFVQIAGPVANWLQTNSALSTNAALAAALMLGCIVLTFAGGFGLMTAASIRGLQGKQGALQLAAAGATWLVLAVWWPLFSQVTFVVFGLAFLLQSAWNSARLAVRTR